MTDQMCQKWFARFHAGDFSLDNAPQSSRPVEVETDRLLRTINSTMWEIADILKIFKSIKLFVKMKNVSFLLWKKTKWTFWPTQYKGTSRKTIRRFLSTADLQGRKE